MFAGAGAGAGAGEGRGAAQRSARSRPAPGAGPGDGPGAGPGRGGGAGGGDGDHGGGAADGALAVSILASLLPPPSQFALVRNLPEALRNVVAAQRHGQFGEETLRLVVEGFAAVKDFLLALSPADLDRDEHEDLLDAFVWLLQDLDVRSEVRDIICVDDLVRFLGLHPDHDESDSKEEPAGRGTRAGAGAGARSERIPSAPPPAEETTQPIWVATQIFRAIRCLLSTRPCFERDLTLERIMKNFVRATPLAGLRELSAGHLEQFVRNLSSLESRNGLRQSAVLVFVKSPVLQRRLDAIDLIVNMETATQWLTTHRILETLLERTPVHPELCRRAEPIVRLLARENLLTTDTLSLIRGVSIDLLCAAVQEIPEIDILKQVVGLVNGGSARVHEVAKLIRTIARRPDLDAPLAESCVIILWELRDAEGVTTAVLSHCEFDDSLLEIAVELCMRQLDRDASFFAHRVLDLMWRQIAALGDVLRASWGLEDRWLEAMESCLAALDETAAEEPDLANALDLGTQLLLHETDADAQGALALRIWRLFMPHLGDAPPVRARITGAYFTWLAHLCETMILMPRAAHALFTDSVVPFVQAAQPTVTAYAFGPECFGFVRSVFLVSNQSRLVNLKDTADRAENEPADDPDADGDPLAYVVLTCDPGELEGVQLLWHMAVHTWSDAVAQYAVSALQALYDPSLDPENKRAARVRRDYVAKCSRMLDELPADATQAIQRCLGFVEALLNDADHRGTRGFRPHGARQRGQIHSLVLIGADAYGNEAVSEVDSEAGEHIFEVTLYSNATIWDIRCAVAARLPTPVPATKIMLTWPAGGEPGPLGDEENSTTLADLGFSKSETLMFKHLDDEALLQDMPRVRLLDERSREFTPLAQAAFAQIFDDWASDQDQGLLNLEDFTHLFTFCTGATNVTAIKRRCATVLREYASVFVEAENEGNGTQEHAAGEPHMTCKDFLRFYMEAAQTRPMSVWKDILKLGFDTKLQRNEVERGARLTSEFRLSWFEQAHANNEDDGDGDEKGDDIEGSGEGQSGDSSCESSHGHHVETTATSRRSRRVSGSTNGWRPILAHEATLYRVLFRLLKSSSAPVSRTAWSILLRLPTSKSVLAALGNIETAKLPAFFSVNAAGHRFVQYSLHVLVSFMEADESRQLIGAAGGKRARADSVEQHFERARRASFEPNRPGGRQAEGDLWTQVFLDHQGLALLQGLVQSALDQVEQSVRAQQYAEFQDSAGIGSLEATPMGQILELALKAIKLCLTCTKFGSASVLANLELNEQLQLVDRARRVINGVLAGHILSMLSAEYALFIWDFFFSWLHKQPEEIVRSRAGEIACIDLKAAQQRPGGRGMSARKSSSLSSEAVFSRHVWQDALVESLERVGSRFAIVRDRYLDMLTDLEVEGGGLCDWLQAVTAQLVVLKPVSMFMPSSPQFDIRLLNSLVKRISGGALNSCQLLAVMVREDERTIVAMASAEFTVHELVVQLSHRLTSAKGGQHRGAILDLLAAIAECDSAVANVVADTVLVPLLRSKDPTVTKRTNRRQSLDRRDHRVGLVNLHNTCYMNSLLQQLALIPPVRDLIFGASEDAEETSWLGALQLAVGYLLRSERKSFTPVQLINALNINPREQQDCEEFMNRLFELLEDATNDASRWGAAFGGSMLVQRTCRACKAQHSVVESVGTHIAIDVRGSQTVCDSLERSSFCEEVLEGFRCENCGEVDQVVQRRMWDHVPQALIFHLKRFRFDLGLGAKEKLTDTFCFEERLFGRDLVGIICHQGEADGGHYYSYVRARPDERSEAAWFELNDTNVRTLDGFPAEAYQSAYILCYMDEASLSGPAPVLPRALQTKIDRDNLSLESSCTVQHPQFWRLCDVVLKRLLQEALAAPGPASAASGPSAAPSPSSPFDEDPSAFFDRLSLTERPPERTRAETKSSVSGISALSERSSPKSPASPSSWSPAPLAPGAVTPEQRRPRQRRGSMSPGTPLAPSWWPQETTVITMRRTPGKSGSRDLEDPRRDSPQQVIVNLSPSFSDRRSLVSGRAQGAEMLALSLLRMLSIESIFRVEDSVVTHLHNAVLSLCEMREDFVVLVAQTLMTLSASYPLVPTTFVLAERFLQQAHDDDALELVLSIILRSESFIEASVACFEKAGPEVRKSVCRGLMVLVHATASALNAPYYASACEAFDWVFSNEPGFPRVFLRTCEKLVGDPERFTRLARDLSSLSVTCAEMTTVALLEGLDRAEETHKLALRLILALDDRLSRARLNALLAPRGIASWAHHLPKILALIESEVGQNVRMQCLGSPSGLLFCCTNVGAITMQVHLWFPDLAAHQTYRLATPNTALAIDVSPGQTSLVYFAERLPRQPGKAVSPTRGAIARCDFEWDAQPSPSMSAWPSSVLLASTAPSMASLASTSTSTTAKGSAPEAEVAADQENDRGAKVNVNDTRGAKGEGEDDDAEVLAQAKKLAAMGFSDEGAIVNALKVANGDEQVAVEILLTESDSM